MVMRMKIFPILLVFLLLLSCTTDTHQIRVACDNTSPEVYTVKWELFPARTGKVRIYESVNPNSFDQATLVDERSIEDGYSIIPRKDEQRRFYRLVFNKKCSALVGERYITTEKIDNLRDIGGYFKGKNKQVQWGKLYRSGSLFRFSEKDKSMLESLQIKTILDLRDTLISQKYPTQYTTPVMEHLCLHGISADSTFRKVMNGQMKKGDVLISLQDMYAQNITEDTACLAKLFDILSEEKNYPVLFHCTLGKDRAGLVSILILEALGIDRDQIFQDYMLSNQYIDFNRAVSLDPESSAEAQEALTTLLSASEHLFNFVYEKIRMEYGSMSDYLEKTLGLTDKKRDKLKEILLY